MIQWWAVALAALAGAVMAVQGSMNAGLSKIAGLWEMVLLVHVLGTLVVGLIILTPFAGSHIGRLTEAPLYLWLGGPAGVFIVYSVARSIPRIGVTAATTSIIVAQLSAAAIIDHLGLFGLEKMTFHPVRLLGVALMGGGAYILLLRLS